jgi:hypothetical protein
MYLFTRQLRLRAGAQRASLTWAANVTEKVNQITELNVGLWRKILSPGLGTISWSCVAQDLTELENADAKLAVDDIFVGEVDRGAQFVSDDPVIDETAQFLTEVDVTATPPKYVAVVRSELRPGGFAKGVEAGLEIASRATKVGGVTTSFLIATTGKYGGVAWISGGQSLKEIEDADQKINADADFVKYVDKVGPDAFVPGITTQEIWQQIA